MTQFIDRLRPLNTLKVGDMLTPMEMTTYFNGRPGWNVGVYVCDGAHRDGSTGFKVLEVRNSTPAWGLP